MSVLEDPSGHWIEELVQFILNYESPEKVVDFTPPEALEEELAAKFTSNLNPDLTQLKQVTKFLLSKCVNTNHRYFLNQLYGGVHPVGLAAAVLVERMNTNQHTYDVAPVFVLTETIILREIRKVFFGTEVGDGIFAPGGSIANMYAMVLARYRSFPLSKTQGVSSLPPMVVFTSEDAHYSVTKAANWMGIGTDNVVKVPTVKSGSMIPEELEKAIYNCRAEGKHPLIVVTTAGTTVLGAFDPFNEIAEICHKEEIWMHCDAAWGGAMVFSPLLKSQWLNGIEKSDSIAWNAHKMLCAPLQCSALIVKKENALLECNALKASYLFQTDKYYSPAFDTGNKSVQCGRKADAFKLWYMWMVLGTEGFKNLVEAANDCARYFTNTISTQQDFKLFLDEHQCTNVFFWFIPRRLQGQSETEDWWLQVNEVTTKLKEKMVFKGEVMIGYSPLPHKRVVNALRLVLPAYPRRTFEDMDFIIDHIRQIGKDL